MGYQKGIIFDGYVDEPTALGVPPFISPYPRYVAGAFAEAGIPYRYLTVDQWRSEDEWSGLLADAGDETLLVVICGLTVPGHYRGGTPLMLHELQQVLESTGARAVVGGPVRHGYTLTGGTAALAMTVPEGAILAVGDLDEAVATLLTGGSNPAAARRPLRQLAARAVAGALVTTHHPWFPHIIAEIETARGCERKEHCSFCTENLGTGSEFRPGQHIQSEIGALAQAGVVHFRLGKQPNLFAWPGKLNDHGDVVPEPTAVAALFQGIRNVAPGLKTLHIDNVNPGFVARFPAECEEIAAAIASFNTPGDVAAFGVESVDPEVFGRHSLKATAGEVMTAIEILNRAGGRRQGDGLPALLPGINLLFGLPGESAATYERNLAFLEEVASRGLLLRRINVRQVMVFAGTPLQEMLKGRNPRVNKARFHRFKRRLAERVERPMLQQLAPIGTRLPGIITEFRDGDVTFGRQPASYPLLAGFPCPLPLRQIQDGFVVGHGFRSVTVLPDPLPVNTISERALQALPGVGRKRAHRIVAARPFTGAHGLLDCLDDSSMLESLLHRLSFE